MCFLDLLQCFLYIRKLRVPSLYKRLHFTLLLSYSSLIITKIITSSIVIGLKNYFPVKLLSESLLSDSLLSDSSISQPYSKLGLKSTNHIKSCSLNQPIVILLMQIFPFFHDLAIPVSRKF